MIDDLLVVHSPVARVLWDFILALAGVKWVFPEMVRSCKAKV